MTTATFVPHCRTCKLDVVPSASGRCSWCDEQLERMPVVPQVAEQLQRALEATVLFHLTEPRGTR